jgi:hypothetical protein
VLEYHFGILYIVIPFKLYNFTNLATWVHLGYLCGTPGWLHDKCHVSTLILEVIILKLCTGTVALMFFTEIVSIILSECLFYLVHFKDDGITIKNTVLSKPDLLCYILLHSIHINTKFSVFFSNGTNNMHILGSAPELQAVRCGYVFRRKLKKVGASFKRLIQSHNQSNVR